MFVRLAIEEDLPAIIELARINCELSTPHLQFSEERVQETFADYIKYCDTTFFVAEHQRQVVGLLVATINNYRHAYGQYTTQEVIFVHPAFHGSRAAVLLVKELIRWSEMLGAIEITGGNDNSYKSDRTARFLEHFGFEQVGFFMRRMMKNG